MSSPCRGDCNQGRSCYCGESSDDTADFGLVVVVFICASASAFLLLVDLVTR
jgi:hypothetical protein